MSQSSQESLAKKKRIKWYRCPIETEKLRELTKRSDIKGAFFGFGQLLLFAAAAYLVHYFFTRQLWVGFAVTLWLYGTMRGVAGSGRA